MFLSRRNFSKLQELKAQQEESLIGFFIDHWVEQILEELPSQDILNFDGKRTHIMYLPKRYMELPKEDLHKGIEELFEFRVDFTLFPTLSTLKKFKGQNDAGRVK